MEHANKFICKLRYINKKRALQALLNDEALYNVLLNDFVALQPELVALRKAIDEKDFQAIFRIAHIFTTALKYIGAYELAEITHFVELTIQDNEQEAVGGFMVQLDLLYHELIRMTATVRQLADVANQQSH